MSQPSVEEAIGAQLRLTPNKLRAGVLWRWHSDPHVWAPLGLNGSEAGSGVVEGSWKLEPAAANVKGVVQVEVPSSLLQFSLEPLLAEFGTSWWKTGYWYPSSAWQCRVFRGLGDFFACFLLKSKRVIRGTVLFYFSHYLPAPDYAVMSGFGVLSAADIPLTGCVNLSKLLNLAELTFCLPSCEDEIKSYVVQ